MKSRTLRELPFVVRYLKAVYSHAASHEKTFNKAIKSNHTNEFGATEKFFLVLFIKKSFEPPRPEQHGAHFLI